MNLIVKDTIRCKILQQPKDIVTYNGSNGNSWFSSFKITGFKNKLRNKLINHLLFDVISINYEFVKKYKYIGRGRLLRKPKNVVPASPMKTKCELITLPSR